ncbi:beta family protein [Vibrio mediterranei]|uniref:beta family protein n=1 Tax=Vibrio mediterranei TaxID=689 RepID=UPI0038CE450C
MSEAKGTFKNYLPILKWRQGEYQALLRLNKEVKKNLYPLFVIPPVEFDFEEQKPKKSAEQHVEKLADRYIKKWGKALSLIDIDSSLHLDNVSDGRTIPEYIFDELELIGGSFSPVLQLDYDVSYVNAVKKSWLSCQKGMCIRVSLDQLADASSSTQISNFHSFIGCPEDKTDLVIDFKKGASYEPYENVVELLSMLLGTVCNVNQYRSIYIVGTSLALDEVKKPGAKQQRHDWLFYKSLHSTAKSDFPNIGFGDYTIETPEFSSLDMRLMKPAAKIVYSSKNNWIIFKGTSFRDNPAQMKDLCDALIKSGYYYDPAFSNGDKKIHDCSLGICGTGNMSTWKEAAISHHLTLAVHQNASLYVP